MKKQNTKYNNNDEGGKKKPASRAEDPDNNEELLNSGKKSTGSKIADGSGKAKTTGSSRGASTARDGSSGYNRGNSTGSDRSKSFHKRPSSERGESNGYKRGTSTGRNETSGNRRESTNGRRESPPYREESGYKKRESSDFRKDARVNRSESSYDKRGYAGQERTFSGYKSDKPGFKKQRPRIKRSSDSRSSGRSNTGTGDNSIRLNRYLATSGIASRRQADQYISEGLVSVNGTVVTEMGIKVMPGDVVKFNGETIKAEKKVYILLNKPKDYITTAKDNEGRKTVYDLIRGACPERVYPVGRLDRNSMGVLLLSNDGDLAARLSHPKYQRKKVYHVFLDKNLKLADFELILTGVELKDGFIKADDLSYSNPPKKDEVGIEIHSGKNRIVRRIFEHLGYKVIKLDRVLFAGLTKKNLQRGKWRFLTEKELNMLKMNVFE